MHVALPIFTALFGAWFALTVRALVAGASQKRIERAAQTLDPEHLERLRSYIADVDNAARGQVAGHRLKSV